MYMSSLQQVFDQGTNHKKTIAIKQLEYMFKCTKSAELLDFFHAVFDALAGKMDEQSDSDHQIAERSCWVFDLRLMV